MGALATAACLGCTACVWLAAVPSWFVVVTFVGSLWYIQQRPVQLCLPPAGQLWCQGRVAAPAGSALWHGG